MSYKWVVTESLSWTKQINWETNQIKPNGKFQEGKYSIQEINRGSGRRVVWIGFWSSAPAHTLNSVASHEHFQASDVTSISSSSSQSSLTSLMKTHHSSPVFLCAHSPGSGDVLQGQWLAPVSDLPQGSRESDWHSACDLCSELPPTCFWRASTGAYIPPQQI